MGLDMYLTKSTYVQNWAHRPDVKHKVRVTMNNKTRKDIKPERVSEVIEDVMYWRKANHIHAWFVENCQDGEDNCQRTHVPREKLDELATLCEEVLQFKADGKSPDEILPTQAGFFFGATEYDEYYYGQCKETAEVIRELLKENNPEGTYSGEFYYQSSW